MILKGQLKHDPPAGKPKLMVTLLLATWKCNITPLLFSPPGFQVPFNKKEGKSRDNNFGKSNEKVGIIGVKE